MADTKLYRDLVDKVVALNDNVDNLLSLTQGSVTDNAELVGMRTAYDGNEYSSAGEAVREQIKNQYREVATPNEMKEYFIRSVEDELAKVVSISESSKEDYSNIRATLSKVESGLSEVGE